MTYNHQSYKGVHPLIKEIIELENLIGLSFENFSNKSMILGFSDAVSSLIRRKINLKLHLKLEEIRKINFSKYYLNSDKNLVEAFNRLPNMEKLQIIKQEKIAAIRAQNYKQAAEYRDMESAIVDMINNGNQDSAINISIFPKKTVKTAIEICEDTIHVYVITAYEPFKKLVKEILR